MFQRSSDEYVTGNNVETVFPKSSLQSQRSFRLQSSSESITGRSQYFMKYDFKQRIDSMFDETRSAILESGNAHQKKYVRASQSESGAAPPFQHSKSISHPSKTEKKDKRHVKNMVQARIEKMFADVSSSEIEDEGSTPNVQQFQVDYIGSLPLLSRVTSLQGLQEPLKNLYFNYRKNKYPSSNLQALLEISSDGLKVQNFQKNHQTVKEQLNPFPSIAVWAALKFVCRSQNATNGKCGLEYAFLPLVDQPNSEKSSLFRSLDQNDISCAIEKTYDDHSPLFVVIMRQSGTPSNRLQCHGFACATSEDAIVLAANLYKALVATMSNSHITNGSLKKRKKIKCRNGLGTVCSIAGSSVCEEQDYLYPERKPTKTPGTKPEIVKKVPPPRPPRKNKTQNDERIQICSDVLSEIDIEPDEIIVVDDINVESVIITNNDEKNRENEKFNKNKTGNKTSSSICSWQSVNSDKVESGDILTKVVIPRSGSFLNASGPLTSRYNRCTNNYTDGINSSNRRNSIHSPLGFIELFNELRIHEGLNNIDEILNTIIDVDGMSFNSLKPIYKEFIFKLAVTLTKDELYQRSKSIMQKQKRRKKQMMYNRRRAFISGYRIKRVFHTSLSKLRPSKYKIGLPFASHLLKKMQKNKPQFKPKMKLKRQNATSTLTSNDSFVLGFSRHRKNSFKYHSNDIYKDKSFYLKRGEISFHRKKLFSSTHMQSMAFSSTDSIKRFTTGEENLSLLFGDQNKSENISGYVTCSECSYNSESCKYRTSKKCYCSLNKQAKRNKIHRTENIVQQSSVSSCSCDTDSCIESEKCYCNRSKKPSIFEQLKQQGFAASESSLSRPSSPVTAWQRNESLVTSVNKDKTCLQASKSLEFFHVHKNITRLQSNRGENQITTDQNNIFEGHFENVANQSNNSQIQKHSMKTVLMTNNNCDGSNHLNKSNINNNTILNDSENSDDEYTFNNCENQFNNRSQNCIEEESDKDNEILNGSEGFRSDNKYIEGEHNKILVVSTRDQKGQVKNSVTPFYNQSMFSSNIPLKFLRNDNMHENDAISIKKTAEIAALFSDMKVEKKNHINMRSNKDIIYNSLNPPRGLFWNRTGNMCIKNINLENSLGYFP